MTLLALESTGLYEHLIEMTREGGLAHGFLKKSQITETLIERMNKLNEMAAYREQSLAQMALAWCFHKEQVNSVIVGTSSVKQLQDNINALNNTSFSDDELWRIGELG